MKIGDRVFVHGYVDEIRKDTVIIRNNGGYFGTDKSEVMQGDIVRCRDCKNWHELENGTGLCNRSKFLTDATDYCIYGERREP